MEGKGQMRFFTIDERGSGWRDAGARYEDYLSQIRDRLPPALLAVNLRLHDATLVRLEVQGSSVALDLARDWGGIELRYAGVTNLHLSPIATPNDAQPWMAGLGEVDVDEVDIAGTLFEHRLLWQSQAELTLTFADFSWATENESAEQAFDLYRAGRRALDAGEAAAALRHFEAAWRLREHPKTAELIGDCHLRLGQPQHAVPYLEAAVATGKAARPALLLARCLRDLGRRAEAQAAIEIAHARQPANREIQTLRDALRK